MTRLPKLLGAIAAISSVAALAAVPTGVDAQGMRACAPQDTLVEQLGQEFGEAVTAEGVDDSGNLVQVFSSKAGTWTIAVTLPGGPSCIVSSGEGWDDSQIAVSPESDRRRGHSS